MRLKQNSYVRKNFPMLGKFGLDALLMSFCRNSKMDSVPFISRTGVHVPCSGAQTGVQMAGRFVRSYVTCDCTKTGVIPVRTLNGHRLLLEHALIDFGDS